VVIRECSVCIHTVCAVKVLCVRRYCGSRVRLTPASRLVLCLADTDHYRLLLDGLQLQCTMKPSIERLKTELDAKLATCSAVLNSVSLRRFAHLMLQVGNILNEVVSHSAANIHLWYIYVRTVVLYFSRLRIIQLVS